MSEPGRFEAGRAELDCATGRQSLPGFAAALERFRELQSCVDTDPMGTPEAAADDLASRIASFRAGCGEITPPDDRLDGDIARAEALLVSLREHVGFDRANELAEGLDIIRRAARSGRADSAAILLPRWVAAAANSLPTRRDG